jgi:uncharacterized protein YcbK (DUF882 family)
MREMTNDEKIKILRGIRVRIAAAYRSVERKRSWRPSEKAMAKTSYVIELEALDAAIQRMEVTS